MASKNNNANTGPYNWIYKKLVKDAMSKDKHDIVGYIAYSIYKREKIEEIERFKKRNGGKDPSFDDLKPFREMADGRKDEYIQTAKRVLQSYSTNLGIETEKSNHGFWYGVGQSIVASFIYSLIILVVLLFVVYKVESVSVVLKELVEKAG